ncbi:MAG: hypothetical protein FWC76_03795 [Defluviitaleaceae bacterium]|nr:hypothetical protein [Defluviitaleaceae bacterium]
MDEASEYILHNLVTIVVCVTSLVIFHKVKLSMWLRMLLSYVVNFYNYCGSQRG